MAQHSLLVTDLLLAERPNWSRPSRLAALLHDAPEYVIGDLISPFKAAVGLDYKALELRLQRAIHLRFGLPAELTKGVAQAIKRADRRAAFLEATQLAGFSLAEARKIFGRPKGVPDWRLLPATPPEAKRQFLGRFAELFEAVA